MATDESWGRNLRTAKRRFEEAHDTRLTYKEIGKRVAERMGREIAFGHPTVHNWFENGQEPEGFPVVRALAEVLETDVATLLAKQEGGKNGDVPRTPNADVPRAPRPDPQRAFRDDFPDPATRPSADQVQRRRKDRGA